MRRLLGLFAMLAIFSPGCSRETPDDGKLHLDYWEKWTRFEGEAMQRVVRAFNEKPERLQDRIVVHYVTVNGIDRKTLVATAGGDPPDIVGLWSQNVAVFADRGAVQPLDEYLERDGIGPDHWLPVFWGMCQYRGRTWAVPTGPSTSALLWNRAMFRDSAAELRAAGLDPNRAPATVEELDRYAEVLTKRDGAGRIIQMGYLPQEPDWFVWAYGMWWGGWPFHDGRITANCPENVDAMRWVQSYSRKYGLEAIEKFASGFGNFASAQNAFFCGKMAMVIQGVWMHNFIAQYAPGMEWGAAPWPKTPRGPAGFSAADADVLMIPRGVPAARASAAWKFLRFASSQEGMEILCLGQRKISALPQPSESFYANHSHPHVRLFAELARSQGCVRRPSLGVWQQYEREWRWAFDQVRLLKGEPQAVLDVLQEKMQRIYDQHEASVARRGAATD